MGLEGLGGSSACFHSAWVTATFPPEKMKGLKKYIQKYADDQKYGQSMNVAVKKFEER